MITLHYCRLTLLGKHRAFLAHRMPLPGDAGRRTSNANPASALLYLPEKLLRLGNRPTGLVEFTVHGIRSAIGRSLA